MKIVSVSTFALRLPSAIAYLGPTSQLPPQTGYQVRPPWRSLYSPHYETLLVRLVADDGTEGWGEALAPVGPEIIGSIIELLLAPTLLGAPATAPRAVYAKLRGLMRERGHLVGHQADALAAVDIALWDLAARAAQVSLVQLLGGAQRSQIPVYVSGLPVPTDAERAELARDWVRRGAGAVKLHLGFGVAEDLATVDAIRSTASELRIAVDAHWAYSLTEALQLARGLEQRDVWFLEAPLAPEDLSGHAELVRRSGVPIAVGESLRNRYEFAAWLGSKALQIAQPDVARTGISELLIIADLCAAHHVPLAPHHSVGLGIAAAAGIAVSAAIEELLAFEFQPTSWQVGAQLLREPLVAHPRSLPIPDGPGLGIKVDQEAATQMARESRR